MLLWPLVRRTSGGPWISPSQATHLINREPPAALDVRGAHEYAAAHVRGPRNLPLARMQTAGADHVKKKDRPVIVYCDCSERAGKALAVLKRQGYTRVANLSGGLKAWQDA